MSFDIKIDKDNILDALSIYHNLPMNEKTFVRLNAEKLIDKPCKIRNNCKYTNIIFNILPEGKKGLLVWLLIIISYDTKERGIM